MFLVTLVGTEQDLKTFESTFCPKSSSVLTENEDKGQAVHR